MFSLQIIGLRGLPDVSPGDNLVSLIADGVRRESVDVNDGDVFVVTQKIVSKASGRMVRLADVEPSAIAEDWASRVEKDPRLIEVILRESARIVRMDRGIIVAETKHGFVCANAGVDGSNVPGGYVTLLPEHPDDDACKIREGLTATLGSRVAVLICDTFGRPWRLGQVNVAIGISGLKPLADYRGSRDASGVFLQSTMIAVADELASAAELVMGKLHRVPVAIIKGVVDHEGEGAAHDLIRPGHEDMFR
ncbi:MAG: coenzyme F420-0:L-glutamate ligase [Acidobacteria bacterium]|nr:coenzyme F420-0:L-glutamate ligase [Acidobacteriota bacterium]